MYVCVYVYVSVCMDECVCERERVFLIHMMVLTAETLYLAVVLWGDVASYNNYEL